MAKKSLRTLIGASLLAAASLVQATPVLLPSHRLLNTRHWMPYMRALRTNWPSAAIAKAKTCA